MITLLLPACGYHLTAQEPITLPQDRTKLFLSKVTNPTTETWMEPMLRTALRDEFVRRGKVSWVGREQAEATVTLDVKSYTASSSLTGTDETTLKSTATINLVVNFYNARTNALIWTSGPVVASESFRDTSTKRDATGKAVELAVRMVADRMSQNF
jgi:outer membrane lipopolysaccharide assembly protein LptE/RlpB